MMECHFSAPVLPGETLRVALWRAASGVAFRASVAGAEASRIVLEGGWFDFA